jgi:hypothetical protein
MRPNVWGAADCHFAPLRDVSPPNLAVLLGVPPLFCTLLRTPRPAQRRAAAQGWLAAARRNTIAAETQFAKGEGRYGRDIAGADA